MVGHHGGHPVADCTEEVLRVTELARDRQVKGDLGGHRPIGAKEVCGSTRVHRTPVEQQREAVDTGPMKDSIDEPVLDGIGSCVHDLVDDIDTIHEVNDGDRLG